MNKTDILLLAVIILNLTQFSISTIIVQRFKDFKDISELFCKINRSYWELCKECIDRYGDAYEQFKLCSERLDKIFTPPPCGCECHSDKDDTLTDDAPIGGFHDD